MDWMTDADHAQTNSADAMLARWLDERQLLIVRLMQTVRAMPDPDAFAAKLDRLCDVLVDYTSVGHFGVYALLLPGSQRDPELAEICRRIDQTTEAVLRFNEYAPMLQSSAARREALSDLSLALEERFELEDGLAAARRRSVSRATVAA